MSLLDFLDFDYIGDFRYIAGLLMFFFKTYNINI